MGENSRLLLLNTTPDTNTIENLSKTQSGTHCRMDQMAYFIGKDGIPIHLLPIVMYCQNLYYQTYDNPFRFKVVGKNNIPKYDHSRYKQGKNIFKAMLANGRMVAPHAETVANPIYLNDEAKCWLQQPGDNAVMRILQMDTGCTCIATVIAGETVEGLRMQDTERPHVTMRACVNLLEEIYDAALSHIHQFTASNGTVIYKKEGNILSQITNVPAHDDS